MATGEELPEMVRVVTRKLIYTQTFQREVEVEVTEETCIAPNRERGCAPGS